MVDVDRVGPPSLPTRRPGAPDLAGAVRRWLNRTLKDERIVLVVAPGTNRKQRMNSLQRAARRLGREDVSVIALEDGDIAVMLSYVADYHELRHADPSRG